MKDRTAATSILLWLGIAHAPLLAFHFAFPWLFQWSAELGRLSSDNAGLLVCFDVCGLFWLGSMGVTTFVEAVRLRRAEQPRMPRGFWLWMAGFYLFRGVAEFPCFGITPSGIAVVALVLVLAAFYLRAWRALAPSDMEGTPDHRFDI